jgi:mono/diheme cytochrome c family protein
MSPEHQQKTVVAWRGVVLAMVPATASAAGTQPSDGSFMSPQRFVQRDGEVIYRTVCQGCHMANAQGAVGAGAYPALANDPKSAGAGYPVLVVVNGSKGMPPFGKLLDDEQVAAVSTTCALISAILRA